MLADMPFHMPYNASSPWSDQMTQILYGTDVDPITGLSRSYQILIFFDSGYNEICKDGVQKAARARFEAMGIVLTRVFFLYFDSQ
jgi:hypothetical protein